MEEEELTRFTPEESGFISSPPDFHFDRMDPKEVGNNSRIMNEETSLVRPLLGFRSQRTAIELKSRPGSMISDFIQASLLDYRQGYFHICSRIRSLKVGVVIDFMKDNKISLVVGDGSGFRTLVGFSSLQSVTDMGVTEEEIKTLKKKGRVVLESHSAIEILRKHVKNQLTAEGEFIEGIKLGDSLTVVIKLPQQRELDTKQLADRLKEGLLADCCSKVTIGFGHSRCIARIAAEKELTIYETLNLGSDHTYFIRNLMKILRLKDFLEEEAFGRIAEKVSKVVKSTSMLDIIDAIDLVYAHLKHDPEDFIRLALFCHGLDASVENIRRVLYFTRTMVTSTDDQDFHPLIQEKKVRGGENL